MQWRHWLAGAAGDGTERSQRQYVFSGLRHEIDDSVSERVSFPLVEVA